MKMASVNLILLYCVAHARNLTGSKGIGVKAAITKLIKAAFLNNRST